MTHRGPQTATPEKDEINHTAVGNTLTAQTGKDTGPKMQRLHTCTPSTDKMSDLSSSNTHTQTETPPVTALV